MAATNRNLVENKLVKGPTTRGGDKKSWRHWSSKLEGYIAGISQDLLGLMEAAARHQAKIVNATLAEPTRELSGILFFILNGLTTGDAYDELLNCEKGNGLEVWRRHAQKNAPQTIGHNRSRMMNILEPTDLACHPYEKKKDLWEKRHSDYVALGNAEIAEEVSMGVST